LAGYPTNACFHKQGGRLCILRWLCGDSAADILSLVESQLPPSKTAVGVSFIHPGGSLCLIGASDYGPELGYQPLTTELAAGCYSVNSYFMKRLRTEILIHRFDC